MKSVQLLIPGALVAVCLCSDAHAGGYATARFGGEHGHAASDHTTSIYYNPAGLAHTKGSNLYIEGLFVHRMAGYERPAGAIGDVGGGTPDDPEAIAANSGKAELNNFLVSPFIGFSTDLGTDTMGFGVGLYAPFGGQASWGTNDAYAQSDLYPGATDGVQRWHTIEGVHRVVYVTAAGAMRLPAGLSVGMGVNLVMQDMSTLRARNIDGSDDLVTAAGNPLEGRTLFEGKDTSFSLSGGITWDANEDVRVGLSYQSTPGFGENSLKGELTTQAGLLPPGDPIDSELLLTLPDIVRWGVQYKVSPTVELRVGGDYQRWSVFKRHCVLASVEGVDPVCDIAADGAEVEASSTVLVSIPRNWKDTFGVRVGASYWMVQGVELFGGVAFDSNAVPDQTLETGLVDMNKIISNVGARMALLRGSLMLTGSLSNVFYMSRDIPVRNPADAFVAPSVSPDAAGKYTQTVNFLTVGAQYVF